MDDRRALRITLWLIAAALLLESVLGSLGRTLVEMPSWRHLGVEAWAAFSRGADLGMGKVIYPIAGIGGTVLLLGAAVAYRLSPHRRLAVAIPVYGAACMSVCILLTTTQAAPKMLSLQRIGADPALLQRAFDGFYKWDSIRAVFGALAGCAAIWALAAVASAVSSRGAHTSAAGDVLQDD